MLRSEFIGAEFFIGQWLQFVDANGGGFAQPDLFIRDPFGLWIVEFKLTWRPDAFSQLTELYSPLLGEIFLSIPQTLVVVCKNLTQGAPAPLRVLADADSRGPHLWQWMR